MLQGYGLTEAAPVISANTLAQHKLGSSGRILPDLEVRICDADGSALPAGARGEIVVRGENVMAGYWRNEKATAEVLRDGWLYTGDLGYLDEDGFLYVLGRVKSLLIADDGEKYSPEQIEEAITGSSPYIEQLMLYNNQSPVHHRAPRAGEGRRPRLAEEARAVGQDRRRARKPSCACSNRELAKHREGGEFGGAFPGRWLPSAVAVLGEGFTEQNHMLNSTMKMVRGKIVEFYRTPHRLPLHAGGPLDPQRRRTAPSSRGSNREARRGRLQPEPSGGGACREPLGAPDKRTSGVLSAAREAPDTPRRFRPLRCVCRANSTGLLAWFATRPAPARGVCAVFGVHSSSESQIPFACPSRLSRLSPIACPLSPSLFALPT